MSNQSLQRLNHTTKACEMPSSFHLFLMKPASPGYAAGHQLGGPSEYMKVVWSGQKMKQ